MNEILKDGKCHSSNKDRYAPVPNFFPTNGGGVVRAAKFCTDCAVRQECLEFALRERIEYGVWGGVSERARMRLLRQRDKSPVAPVAV